MKSILVALAGLVAPGFAHGLMGQWRAMLVVIGAIVLCFLLAPFTLWALVLLLVVWLGSLVDAGLRHRRLRGTIRWTWSYALIAFGAAIVVNLGARVFLLEAFKFPSTSMNPTFEIGDHVFADKLTILWSAPERGDIIIFKMPCQPERDYAKRVVAIAGDTIEIRCDIVYINGKPLASELIAAGVTYNDFDEGGYGRTEAWFTREASRYRETNDGRTYEVFHDLERPERDKAQNRPQASQKDFPDQLRNCGNPDQGEPQARGASRQEPGTIVVTREVGDDVCKPHKHFVVPQDSLFVMGDNRPNSNDSRYWGVVPVDNVKGRITGIWLPLGRIGGVK